MIFNQQITLPQSARPISIIGAGGVVIDAHLPAYQQAGWQVTGIFDLDQEKAHKAKSQFPWISKVNSDLDELISEASQARAILDIAVPANQIIPILQKIPNGTAVLIQKPMGETMEEAQEIFDLCQKKNLIAAVNFQLKYAPYILAAKDMIAKGLLGEVFDLELKACVYTPWGLWDFLKEKPRMEVLYHSVHYLDLVRSFFGSPEKINASVIKHPKNPQLADARSTIILDYENSLQARILTNHGHEYGRKHQESYLKIEGTKGAIKIKIGVSLDYPKGEASTFEYCLLESKEGWKEIDLIGSWFPEAFIGSMASVQMKLQDPAYQMENGISESLETMKLVEMVYQASKTEGIRSDNFNHKNK